MTLVEKLKLCNQTQRLYSVFNFTSVWTYDIFLPTLKIHRLIKKVFTITHIVNDSIDSDAEIVDGIDADQILTDWIGRHSEQLACKNIELLVLVLSLGLISLLETEQFLI